MKEMSSHDKLFIKEHESEDIKILALQSSKYKTTDIPYIIKQIEGRQITKKKIPSWYKNENILYPVHLSLEQASSEATARYKASLCNSKNTFIDLTGGMGIDFSFMSQKFSKAYYVEQQSELVELACHNFKVLGLKNVSTINDNARDYLNNIDNQINIDTIYIDPARRNKSGSKTVMIEDCTPNLIELDATLNLKSEQTIIKLSPMLDITLAINSLSNITDIHIVSLNNECKELLFIKSKKQKNLEIHCVNILNNESLCIFSFFKEEENQINNTYYTSNIKSILYEPNSSILKAGAFNIIANRYNLEKLHPNSHLYTSNIEIKDFPGRTFRVDEITSLSKRNIPSLKENYPKANIATRNYPLSVAEIRKQTKIKEGGDKYIFATTLANEKKVLILTHKI